MRYPVVIHKETGSDYGVTVPDLPGCFSAGESMDEALAMAQEAIECHIEGLLLDGEAAPMPKQVEDHYAKAEYAGGTWALVAVNLAKLSGKSRRVNITLPERVLNVIDEYASHHGETRSGLIAQAALEFIAEREEAAVG